MKIENCRLCSGKLSEPKLKFPPTPLANEFLKEAVAQDLFPLEVCACITCGHYQLNESIDPERLFRHYVYVAGTSPVNVEHFRQYAEHMVKYCELKPGSKVLDIASNDGVLLKHFKDLGMQVLGIDPAKNLAEEANRQDLPTIPEFFTEEYSKTMLEEHGKFDLITANNVFAHVPDMIGFAKGVKNLLAEMGVFTFEVSYFGDVCDKVLFDTVYHEHLSYHTLKPLFHFFNEHGMEVFDIEKLPNHGGSIRVFVRNKEDVGKDRWHPGRWYCFESGRITYILDQEKNIEQKVEELQQKIKYLGLELREILHDYKEQDKSIAIYGTPAKATTLMYALGIKKEWVDFAVDDNPLKQGTFTPGMHIPVLSCSAINDRKPNVVLVLAWNFAPSIIEKCKKIFDKGYNPIFITPLPELKIEKCFNEDT